MIKSNEELTKYFLENYQGEDIVSALFDFFEFNCLQRCKMSQKEFDKKIFGFKESGYKDKKILQQIIEDFTQAKKRVENELLKIAVKYIDDNPFEQTTVEEIATNINVSSFYLTHLFQKHKNMSISEYRTRKRLAKAFMMLVKTDNSISDIAYQCGFDSSSCFSNCFKEFVGEYPSSIRNKKDDILLHDFYELEDMVSALYYKPISFISKSFKESNYKVSSYYVKNPDDYKFLHECAIINFNGVLYASWYQCPVDELMGHTPICGKRSKDGGKTWSEIEFIAEDKTDKVLYCPPVYGIDDGKLYMFVNQMVDPDYMHSLDLYVLDESTDKFKLLWSKPIPFKLNTNVLTLPNGKLMLSGRMGELDGFPITPAILISDSGKIDSEWRLVKIAENGILPDNTELIYPEITPIVIDESIYMFCRNDNRAVPLIYVSNDLGQSFNLVQTHDIPFWESKIYSGTLSDGRNYIVFNADRRERTKLSLYLTKPNSMEFVEYQTLCDANLTECFDQVHYPCCVEMDGKLYVIATYELDNRERGSILFIVDVNKQ